MATAAEKLANNLNFGALGKATELRNRLLFTLGALIVFRLGTFLPIPGINPLALQQFFEQQSSGILGILSSYSNWFLQLTPLNLFLYFALLLWNIDKGNEKLIIALSIPFFLGFLSDFLGVNYDLIFGSYEYGENLGFKLLGVPLMICVNWIVLTMITADISRFVSNSLIITSLIGALLMTLLDVLIEVSAPRFDFWEFENGIVPIQNYLGWFVVSFVAHLGYQKFDIRVSKKLSVHIFIAIVIFFLTFLFF